MTQLPAKIEGAEYYGADNDEPFSCDTLDEAVREYIEDVEWYLGDKIEAVTILGAVALDPNLEDEGDGVPVKEVGRVTIDLREWCQQNWQERLTPP